MLEKAIFGDVNKRRISFVKERLVDITWGRRPDGDCFLDENGKKRPLPPKLPPPLASDFPSRYDGPSHYESCENDHAQMNSEYSEAGASLQEQARKEWLQYYLEISNWQKASELVLTKAEQDDLDYLMKQQGAASAASPYLQTVEEHSKPSELDSPML